MSKRRHFISTLLLALLASLPACAPPVAPLSVNQIYLNGLRKLFNGASEGPLYQQLQSDRQAFASRTPEQKYQNLKTGLRLQLQLGQSILTQIDMIVPSADESANHQLLRVYMQAQLESARRQLDLFPGSLSEFSETLQMRRDSFKTDWIKALSPALNSDARVLSTLGLSLPAGLNNSLLPTNLAYELLRNPDQSVQEAGTYVDAALDTISRSLGVPMPNTELTPEPIDARLKTLIWHVVDTDGKARSSVLLSWNTLPATVWSTRILRRQMLPTLADEREIARLTSERPRYEHPADALTPGAEYHYSLRGERRELAPLQSGSEELLKLDTPAQIPAFKITFPAADDAVLKDPFGTGHTFTWQDAGTGLYHVQVSDATGRVFWGTLTRATQLTYGSQSRELTVPAAASSRLVLSSSNPDVLRDEVFFRGIGATGLYRIQVTALETSPVRADLSSAKSVTVRTAPVIQFFSQ